MEKYLLLNTSVGTVYPIRVASLSGHIINNGATNIEIYSENLVDFSNLIVTAGADTLINEIREVFNNAIEEVLSQGYTDATIEVKPPAGIDQWMFFIP